MDSNYGFGKEFWYGREIKASVCYFNKYEDLGLSKETAEVAKG